MIDNTFHYPPELLNLLIDTIPRLCKSKDDVLLFFKGAGVPSAVTHDLEVRVKTDRANIPKFEIAREILTRINVAGDKYLRERREILKRVTEFEDFSVCWANDSLQAEVNVGKIRQIVNVKDSFTRMNQERQAVMQAHQASHSDKIKKIQQLSAESEVIKKDFYALFVENNAQKRGKALESVLNRLFEFSGILVREAFTLVGNDGEGIVEQIDGAIELDGAIYLVEMKWWKEPLGSNEVSSHIVKVYSRSDARGIFISASGYTQPALVTSREALRDKIFILCKLEEIIKMLEQERDLSELLKRKVQFAILDKNPFYEIGE